MTNDRELELLSSKIDVGVKAAISSAIARHRQLGQSISVMKDGKVVTLTADEIAATQVNEMDKTSSLQS